VAQLITEQDIARHRPALIAWAEANGLDPDRISQDGLAVEYHGNRQVIVYDEYQLDQHGAPITDPDRPGQVLRVRRSRPLRHALPDGLGRSLCACALGQPAPGCPDHHDQL
jgi:hypothetical protein